VALFPSGADALTHVSCLMFLSRTLGTRGATHRWKAIRKLEGVPRWATNVNKTNVKAKAAKVAKAAENKAAWAKINAKAKAKSNVSARTNNVSAKTIRTNASKMSAPASICPPPARLLKPDVQLVGEVNQAMFDGFKQALQTAGENNELVVEVTTLGGDADIGRRLAGDIRAAEAHLGKRFWFVGRSYVYSIGVVIMTAFAKERRVLSGDATLLIHERKLSEDVHLEDGLEACLRIIMQVKAKIENGIRLEREGFAELAAGSELDVEEIIRRAGKNWYVTAHEALELGFVAHLLD
jgi:ATP-dependent Clp protease, protease subunit